MIGIILAAGEGKRLRTVWELPKVLLPINGKTLLERHIEGLRYLGAEKIVVTVGYKKEDIIEFLNKKGFKNILLAEGQKGDTKYGRSLKKTISELQIRDDIIYVMGDHYINYKQIPQEVFDHEEADFLMIGNSVPIIVDPHSASRVLIDKKGRILYSGKDIRSFDLLDTGLFLLRKQALEILDGFEKEFDTTHIVKKINSVGKKAKAIDIPDLIWFGCNTPEEVLRGILWLERKKVGLIQ